MIHVEYFALKSSETHRWLRLHPRARRSLCDSDEALRFLERTAAKTGGLVSVKERYRTVHTLCDFRTRASHNCGTTGRIERVDAHPKGGELVRSR